MSRTADAALPAGGPEEIASASLGVMAEAMHREYWASYDIQPVRQSGSETVRADRSLYLLLSTDDLVICDPRQIAARVNRRDDVHFVLLFDRKHADYAERAVSGADGRFLRFERLYGQAPLWPLLLGVTGDAEIARAWQQSGTSAMSTASAGGGVPDERAFAVQGQVYDARAHESLMDFVEAITDFAPGGECASRFREEGAEVGSPGVLYLVGKRAFDIVFALLALLLTLPLYPLIICAIWLEDGRPFFFVQSRETKGGRRFPCLKFRSMRKDAEAMKAKLEAENGVDGPQFYMRHDPRVLIVGRLLRPTKMDEIPQFLNVLLGHMSVIGPRPSPFEENQYCPAWRDARLAMRPGITGLWQVRRTRRPDLDFQEWIRYDVEYVSHASWWLDLKILLKTVPVVLTGR